MCVRVCGHARIVFAFSPNSAACERVFSLSETNQKDRKHVFPNFPAGGGTAGLPEVPLPPHGVTRRVSCAADAASMSPKLIPAASHVVPTTHRGRPRHPDTVRTAQRNFSARLAFGPRSQKLMKRDASMPFCHAGILNAAAGIGTRGYPGGKRALVRGCAMRAMLLTLRNPPAIVNVKRCRIAQTVELHPH